MILGTVLLFVGSVLFINGLALLGRISTKEAAVMNVLSGSICFLASCYSIFGTGGNEASVKAGSYGLLFAFTYLWVATNNLFDFDGRGLGWFSFFVALTAVPIAWDNYIAASSFQEYWLTYCWSAWAVLWFAFFLLGACDFKKYTHPIAYLTIFEAISTAWLPGYLILSGNMP